MNVPLTANNPRLLVVICCHSLQSQNQNLGLWDVKRQSMVGCHHPSEQAYHHPCPAGVRATDLRQNSAVGLHALLLPALLLSIPEQAKGENEAQRRHRFTLAHTANY